MLCNSRGESNSTEIYLGNDIVLATNGNYDGIIVKYDSKGNVIWGKVVGGTQDDKLNGVIETADGGYIAVGSFKSEIIDLGNGVTIVIVQKLIA